jgi:hypothetical protein
VTVDVRCHHQVCLRSPTRSFEKRPQGWATKASQVQGTLESNTKVNERCSQKVNDLQLLLCTKVQPEEPAAMYIAIVTNTMFILPVGSILFAVRANPDAEIIDTMGKWFVFWGVGARLGLAGARQILRPEFTARDILGVNCGDGALIIVRELGFANLSIGIVALLVLRFPAFVLPAAIYSTIFYAAAGVMHVMESKRGLNENVAMLSDLGMALVLGGFAAARLFWA